MVDVEAQALGNVAEQALVDELLGQVAKGFHLVDVEIEVVRVAGLEVEGIAALAHGDDGALRRGSFERAVH